MYTREQATEMAKSILRRSDLDHVWNLHISKKVATERLLREGKTAASWFYNASLIRDMAFKSIVAELLDPNGMEWFVKEEYDYSDPDQIEANAYTIDYKADDSIGEEVCLICNKIVSIPTNEVKVVLAKKESGEILVKTVFCGSDGRD